VQAVGLQAAALRRYGGALTATLARTQVALQSERLLQRLSGTPVLAVEEDEVRAGTVGAPAVLIMTPMSATSSQDAVARATRHPVRGHRGTTSGHFESAGRRPRTKKGPVSMAFCEWS
jgi:hypothetical protein